MDRYLSDLTDIFKDTQGVSDNPLIYSFYNIVPADNSQELLHGETILYPGQINGEFYMTKGHNHVISCAEIYYGLEGEAVVLCEKGNDIYEIELKPGAVAYCRPGYAHRVINKSNSVCRFFCICRADAGHDYNIKFTKRYFKPSACIQV